MEKNEHILFQDIPSNRKGGMFHSAILTTYAIDLVHFDSYIRNVLHRKQISSINILVDSKQLDNTLQYVSPMCLYNAGKDYCISSIRSKGVFHPKINFFVGDDAVLVLVGSGNLTVTGHGKNHEAFSGLMINMDDDTQRPLIEECWAYLKKFTAQTGSFEKQRILREIPENCSFLSDDYSFKPHSYCDINDKVQAALLYNEDGDSILSQISRLVPVEDVDKITILSPYFDDNGAALENLLQLCPRANMDVLLQRDCTLPPNKMKSSERVKFYDFDETKRGKVRIKNYDRTAHAKLMSFHANDKEYCIVGSANATIAGLGTKNKRGINEELCMLYASSSMNFLNQLGLKPAKRHEIDHTALETAKTSKVSEHKGILNLISAHLENGHLTIVTDEAQVLPEAFTVVIEGGNGKERLADYRIEKNIIKADYDEKKNVCICYIANSEGCALSNKILVNNVEALETTNPSPTVRMLNRFVSRIETDGYNGLEVIDMLTDVMYNAVDEDDEIKFEIKKKSSSNGPQNQKETALPTIAYNSEYDNDEVASSRGTKKNYASQLIECIEKSIRRALRRLDDESKDEEEEADSTTSHERIYDEDGSEVFESDIDILVEKSAKALRSYQNLLRRKSRLYINSKGNLSKDDLNFFSLSYFAAMEICYLKRFMYEFDATNNTERSYLLKKLYDGLDAVMERLGIDVFTEFCQFCGQYGKDAVHKQDFDQSVMRTMKYALIFLTFIHRQNKPYCWNKVSKSMKDLIKAFGLPPKEELRIALQPIMERYDYAFKFSYIEQTVKQMGVDW